MQKLSKQQRHEIYKGAYVEHLDDVATESIKRYSMCDNLRLSAFISEIYNYYNDIIDQLPEFKKLKPADKKKSDFWWDKHNHKIRTEMYKKLIKDTQPVVAVICKKTEQFKEFVKHQNIYEYAEFIIIRESKDVMGRWFNEYHVINSDTYDLVEQVECRIRN